MRTVGHLSLLHPHETLSLTCQGAWFQIADRWQRLGWVASRERGSHGPTEGEQVARLPRTDEVAIPHYLLVLPLPSGVEHVILDG